MTNLARVFLYELRRNARRPAYILFSVGVPILAVVIFLTIRVINNENQKKAPQSNAPVVAEDSPLRNVLPAGYVDLAGLIRAPNSEVLIRYPSAEEAQAGLDKGVIAAYFVIAADYLQSGQIDMYFDKFNLGNINNATLRSYLVQSLARMPSQPVDDNTIARLQDRKLVVNNSIVKDGGSSERTNQDASFVLVYLFAVSLMFTAFTTSGYLMQSVIEEKETRMVEVLISSMRPRALLAGKFLALSLLGLVQMVFWFAALIYILRELGSLSPELAGLNITGTQWIVLAIYFILGYLLFCAAYAAIGALASNMREGPQFAALVTIPFAIPIYAIPVFVNAPNGPLPTALSLFPITAPIAMVMRAVLVEVPVGEIILSAILLSLTVLGVIWLAGRFFRVNTLLAGQTPKFRDLFRLVRESV